MKSNYEEIKNNGCYDKDYANFVFLNIMLLGSWSSSLHFSTSACRRKLEFAWLKCYPVAIQNIHDTVRRSGIRNLREINETICI